MSLTSSSSSRHPPQSPVKPGSIGDKNKVDVLCQESLRQKPRHRQMQVNSGVPDQYRVERHERRRVLHLQKVHFWPSTANTGRGFVRSDKRSDVVLCTPRKEQRGDGDWRSGAEAPHPLHNSAIHLHSCIKKNGATAIAKQHSKWTNADVFNT